MAKQGPLHSMTRLARVALLALVVSAAVGAADLPPDWGRALRDGRGTGVLYCNWAAMRAHPVVSRMLELRDQGLAPRIEELEAPWELPLALAGLLPTFAPEIDEMWIVPAGGGGASFARAWVRTTLDGAGLRAALLPPEWAAVALPGGEVLARVGASPDELSPPAWAASLRAERRAQVMEWQTLRFMRARHAAGGWVEIAAPWQDLEAEAPHGAPAAAPRGAAPAPFPFAGLEALGRGTLLALAVDRRSESRRASTIAPGAEDLARAVGDLATLTDAELRLRLSDMRRTPDRTLSEALAGLLVVLSETDAGITVEVEARPAPTSPLDVSVASLELLVGMSSLVTAHASPTLSREARGSVVSVDANGVRLEAGLSTASLLEALDAEAERLAAVRELEGALAARQAAAAAGTPR